MKTKNLTWILLFLIIGVSSVALTNCKKAIEDATTNCVDGVSGCGTAYKVCGPSDPYATTGFYIEYDGVKYPYDSSNGAAVMVEVINIMCPSSSSKEASEGVKQMLDQISLLREEIAFNNSK